MSPERLSSSHKPVIPPAVQADRMHRYSIWMMVLAFLIIALNYQNITVSAVLWFAAGLVAVFAIVTAIGVTLMHGLAWNFDRLVEEVRGGRAAQDVSGREDG